MNRADAESKALEIIDDMAEAYKLTRREIVDAIQNPEVQSFIADKIVFLRLVEEGRTVPMARKIVGKGMYL